MSREQETEDLSTFRAELLDALDGTCIHHWDLSVDVDGQLVAYAGKRVILIGITLERLR